MPADDGAENLYLIGREIAVPADEVQSSRHGAQLLDGQVQSVAGPRRILTKLVPEFCHDHIAIRGS